MDRVCAVEVGEGSGMGGGTPERNADEKEERRKTETLEGDTWKKKIPMLAHLKAHYMAHHCSLRNTVCLRSTDTWPTYKDHMVHIHRPCPDGGSTNLAMVPRELSGTSTAP